MPDMLIKFGVTDLAALVPLVAFPSEPTIAIHDCATVPAAFAALEASGFQLEATRLIATAVSSAIGLSAVRGDAARRTGRLLRFLDSGRNIAAGGPGRLPVEDA